MPNYRKPHIRFTKKGPQLVKPGARSIIDLLFGFLTNQSNKQPRSVSGNYIPVSEKQKALEEKKLKEFLEQRDKEIKEQEEKRVQEILSHESEWGEEMCQWMVENKIDLSKQSKPNAMGIMDKLEEWGQETCTTLLKHALRIGYTVEMVTLALGEPTSIDEQETTEKVKKFRYIYGIPRQGAIYIWFKDGKVTKIKA